MRFRLVLYEFRLIYMKFQLIVCEFQLQGWQELVLKVQARIAHIYTLESLPELMLLCLEVQIPSSPPQS